MAVEHAQAIVVLVHERLFGSAVALVRPLYEEELRALHGQEKELGTGLVHTIKRDLGLK